MDCQPSIITDRLGNNYILQSAQAADAGELMAFVEQASGEGPFFPWSREGCPLLWEDPAGYINTFLAAPRHALLVLRDGGTIMGLCELNGFGSRPEYRHRCTPAPGFLKRYWGRGLVQALWDVVEKLAVSLGYEQVEAHVDSRNLSSRRAVEKDGFRLYGILPKYCKHADGSYSDKYMYVKPLREDRA